MPNKLYPASHNYLNQWWPSLSIHIWVRSRNFGCLVTWFCYQLIAKPGNKTATVLWPDPYASLGFDEVTIEMVQRIEIFLIFNKNTCILQSQYQLLLMCRRYKEPGHQQSWYWVKSRRKFYPQHQSRVNSLWPSDAIWRQGSRSTLDQVMACCLTAPSHYLNQCWLITKVSWCSSEGNFAWDITAISH